MSYEAGPVALKWMREISGLTQRGLAERSGVSERTIRGLEKGAVRTPHQSSLGALIEAAELDERQAAAFLRAWSPARVRSWAELSRGLVEVDDVLAELLLQNEIEESSVACWTMIRVHADRYRTMTFDLVIEAQRHETDSYVIPFAYDANGDLPDLRAYASGCRIRERHDFPHLGVTIFELGLPRALASGECVAFRFELVVQWPEPAPDDDHEWMMRLQTRIVPLTVVEIQFDVPPPDELWEVEMFTDGERRRVRPITPGASGRAQIVKRHAQPGSYGFEWPSSLIRTP